jgi:hypothetical protein
MSSRGRRRQVRPLRLHLLLTAGIIDSTGLAFGWTVILLVVSERGGLDQAASLAASMLVGVALSAPFSAWLSSRLSPRDLLRLLAVGEGACRLGLFVFLWLDVGPWLMAPLAAGLNVLAWSAFAAMRAEVSRAEHAEHTGDSGRSLTRYAVGIASSEALAAGAASMLLSSTPPAPVMVVVAAVYVLSLVPQWWVGMHADTARSPRPPHFDQFRALLAPCSLGSVVFLLAGAPALLATVLAYELYGARGVMVSALSFAFCALGAERMQSRLSRWRPSTLAAFVMGAVMIGGWSMSGFSLIGLAIAQGCAGLAQCSLEGDLDARVVSRVQAGAATAGLAFASSSRALGGALAVALLPAVLAHASLPEISAGAAGLLLAAAVVVVILHALQRVTAMFLVGFVAGTVAGVVAHRWHPVRSRPTGVASVPMPRSETELSPVPAAEREPAARVS